MNSDYLVLPGGSRIPPFVGRRICSSSDNDFSSLQYREWIGVSVNGPRAFVFSERVPPGYFWWITALAGANSDLSNSRQMAFHLIPSRFPQDTTLFLGASNAGPTRGSIRFDFGGTSQNFTQVDNTRCPFGLPSGYFLMAYEEQTAAPVAALHFYTMRAAFFQVPNGQLAPWMG